MTKTASTMLPLGTKAPAFDLPGADGRRYSLDQFNSSKALLVVFMCNHCPYVKHVRKKMSEIITEYQKRGVAVIGINSSDIEAFPDDSPERMKEDAQRYFYTFPYLYDESQETAKAYHAACTPDFFVFDREKRLVYRGRMDGSRPGNDIPVTGRDLKTALDAVVEGREVDGTQEPGMGCNIKWKKGNEPDYFR